MAARFFSRNRVRLEGARKIMGKFELDEVFAAITARTGRIGLRVVSIRPFESSRDRRPGVCRIRKFELRLRGKEEVMIDFLKSLDELDYFCFLREIGLACREDAGLEGAFVIEVFDNFRINRLEAMDYMLERKPGQEIAAKMPFRPVFLAPPKIKKQVLSTGKAGEDISSRLSLVGIIKEKGVDRAVFEDKPAGNTIYVSLNDMIGELTVTQMNGSEVVLYGGGQCYTFSL